MTPSETTLPESILRDFLIALNQWQRNAYLRYRLDNYEFTGLGLRARAEERTATQLQADYADLAERFLSVHSRFSGTPPEVLADPPVFDGFEKQPIIKLPSHDPATVTLEVVGDLDTHYRITLLLEGGRWRVHNVLFPPPTPDEAWEPAYL